MSLSFDEIESSFNNKMNIVKIVSKYPVLGKKFDVDNCFKKEEAMEKVVNKLKKLKIVLTKKDLSKFLYRLRHKIKNKNVSTLVGYESIYQEFLNNARFNRSKCTNSNTVLLNVKSEQIENNSEQQIENSSGRKSSSNSFSIAKNSTPFVVIHSNSTNQKLINNQTNGKHLKNGINSPELTFAATKTKKNNEKKQPSTTQCLTPSSTDKISVKNRQFMSKTEKSRLSDANQSEPKKCLNNSKSDEDLEKMSTEQLKRQLLVENITLSSLKKEVYEKKLKKVIDCSL